MSDVDDWLPLYIWNVDLLTDFEGSHSHETMHAMTYLADMLSDKIFKPKLRDYCAFLTYLN